MEHYTNNFEYRQSGSEIEIEKNEDFDLAKIFECGQCFRWVSDEKGIYRGVARGKAIRIEERGSSIFFSCTKEEFETIWRDYFDLDRNYAEIRGKLCINDYMRQAVDYGKGIRILRQDCWEALCTFIFSQQNNIPRIKKIVSALCNEFGEQIEFDGQWYSTFPAPETLAKYNADDLAPIRSGYRAAYIVDAAKAVSFGELDLASLPLNTPQEARTALKRLRGVGDKVADCVMLFGLYMVDAFPMDVWMKRTVGEYFGDGFSPHQFSPYAGIAQQYIYYYARRGIDANHR